MNSKQPIQERLDQLWQEGARDFAISFLRRAMHADITLAELEAILNFDAVNKELRHIRLSDVMTQRAPTPRKGAAAAPAPRPAAVAAAPAAPTSRKRGGGRRSPKQTDAMKKLLAEVLEKETGGLTTPQLCDKLQEGGFKADAATATLLLRTMETADVLQSDNGRPKTWRLKAAPQRRAAAPMFIRKAGVPEAES